MRGDSPRSSRRAAALRAAEVTAAGAVVLVVVCGLASQRSVWFVVIGTLACALVAGAAFYGAYEGFDERLRRRP